MKTCATCKVEKDNEAFYKKPDSGPNALRSRCKECSQKKRKEKADSKREYDKKHYAKNSKKVISRVKDYSSVRKEEKRAYDVSRAEKRRERVKERYRTDVSYRMTVVLRNRMKFAIKHSKKSNKTAELIGCSLDHLIEHIRSRFEPGMSWELFLEGKIQIDHDTPCAAFDLSKEKDQKDCFNYLNLKPMWSKENNEKRCRVDPSKIREGSFLAQRLAALSALKDRSSSQ